MSSGMQLKRKKVGKFMFCFELVRNSLLSASHTEMISICG